MSKGFDKPYPDLCFLGELVFRPSLTSLQGQGAEVVSNSIPFEGMEFDTTSASCHAGGSEEGNPQGW